MTAKKKQKGKRRTRQCISLRAEVFARLDDYAKAVGSPRTAVVEDAIMARLDALGVPKVPREEALARIPQKREATPEHGHYFTF